ncbi:hypothetical protein OG946_02430 [Streptomyces sp. NBC_01808]|uniref:hypothetical protein n=1 Tax=Streptomyces sp. NBC_01808 TaxID=2975947 RepID=UPI002DD92FDF|nr:hypothetical protein [Streptomyces sp. NBC_01808]WSA36328.1 hypothetical protein OG946_02430 [Streptomyces sp. NBC_01808]
MTFPSRRALTTTATAGALLLAVTACSEDAPARTTPSTPASSSAPASEQPGTSVPAGPSGSDRSTPMDIRVTLGGQSTPGADQLSGAERLTIEAAS